MTDPFADRGREGGGDPEERPVIRDKRRFDPATGELRPEAATPAASAGAAGGFDGPGQLGNAGADAPLAAAAIEAEQLLAERTADLQRVQAEYANYRRRVDRDRQAVAEQALASVLVGLLPLLDDIDRAKAHGESSTGFTVLADGLDATLTKLGLDRFGDSGEPFDPTMHEALTHGYSAEVTEPVCGEIFQPGYRIGDRVLRPARVAVLEPETAPDTDGVVPDGDGVDGSTE